MARLEAGSTRIIGIDSGGEPAPLCAARGLKGDGTLADFPDGAGWDHRTRRPSNYLVQPKPKTLYADHY